MVYAQHMVINEVVIVLAGAAPGFDLPITLERIRQVCTEHELAMRVYSFDPRPMSVEAAKYLSYIGAVASNAPFCDEVATSIMERHPERRRMCFQSDVRSVISQQAIHEDNMANCYCRWVNILNADVWSCKFTPSFMAGSVTITGLASHSVFQLQFCNRIGSIECRLFGSKLELNIPLDVGGSSKVIRYWEMESAIIAFYNESIRSSRCGWMCHDCRMLRAAISRLMTRHGMRLGYNNEGHDDWAINASDERRYLLMPENAGAEDI